MESTNTFLTVLKSTLWYILPIVFPVLLYKHLGVLYGPNRSAKLRGQVVLITGASSGLGEALAHVFYHAGCKVILASRRLEELERVRDSLLTSKSVSINLE